MDNIEGEIIPQQCNQYRYTVDSSNVSEETICVDNLVTKSAPVGIKLINLDDQRSKSELKQQVSAPSYLNSLKDNDAPPFKKPGKEAKPKLLIGTFMNKDEAIEMINAAEENGDVKIYLGKQLVEKGSVANFALAEKSFVTSLLAEAVDYGARCDFNAWKLSCLLSLYVDTHCYFKWYFWLPPTALWVYFKEILIRHTIEDSPDGEEVFEPDESYDILTHFHTVYMNNLPLIHTVTFGAHRLKFSWPFNKK